MSTKLHAQLPGIYHTQADNTDSGNGTLKSVVSLLVHSQVTFQLIPYLHIASGYAQPKTYQTSLGTQTLKENRVGLGNRLGWKCSTWNIIVNTSCTWHHELDNYKLVVMATPCLWERPSTNKCRLCWENHLQPSPEEQWFCVAYASGMFLFLFLTKAHLCFKNFYRLKTHPLWARSRVVFYKRLCSALSEKVLKAGENCPDRRLSTKQEMFGDLEVLYLYDWYPNFDVWCTVKTCLSIQNAIMMHYNEQSRHTHILGPWYTSTPAYFPDPLF